MFKCGIIGCGVIAPSHVQAIQENGLELYAACDIIKEKADSFAQKYGAKKVYYDYKEMLADPDIDIVAICTPSGLHGEMAIAAARAGKHIICEKPMEITQEKLNAVCEALKSGNAKMMCVFQRRFNEISLKVKEAIDKGMLGRILVADAYLKYFRSREYYKSADWRATWELDGGGALMNQGIHGVDLIAWLNGGVKSLYAYTDTRFHNIEVEDTAICIVKYNNGAVGIIQCTTCVNPGQSTRFEIHGEKGSIIFDDSGVKQWFIDGKDYCKNDYKDEETGIASNPLALGPGLSHTPIYKELVDAIKNGSTPSIPPEEGKKAVEIILKIYESSKKNQEIELR